MQNERANKGGQVRCGGLVSNELPMQQLAGAPQLPAGTRSASPALHEGSVTNGLSPNSGATDYSESKKNVLWVKFDRLVEYMFSEGYASCRVYFGMQL